MRTPIPDYLDEVTQQCRQDTSGEVAAYIPELAQASPDRLAAAIATLDGHVYAVGDAQESFTIQSISKPFVYALALQDRGQEAILAKVSAEPSGDAFNEISLEDSTGRPRNPMINIGAITTTSLVGEPGCTSQQRWDRIAQGLSDFAGRALKVDEAVRSSELATAHRNLALAHMVRSHEIIDVDPTELVADYVRQCALAVTTKDLAVMAATLANGGTNPITGVCVVDSDVVRQVLSVMTTCGMYDAAGDWVSSVGIPAKSGVSGGVLGALPGQVGVATFSPRLDTFGNSVRGVQICERLSRDMGLHMMQIPAIAPELLRDVRHRDTGQGLEQVVELQGSLQFAGAERVLRRLAQIPADTTPVVLDLGHVSQANSVARRMLNEGVRRLQLDGHPVSVVDPESVLGTAD